MNSHRGVISLEFMILLTITILFFSIVLLILENSLISNLRLLTKNTLSYSLYKYSTTFDYESFFMYGCFDIDLPPFLNKSQVDVIPRLEDIHIDNKLYIESLKSNILVVDLQKDIARKLNKENLKTYTPVYTEVKIKKNKNEDKYYYSLDYLITLTS